MSKILGYPVVTDISFTATEKVIEIDDCFKLILNAEENCSVSLNDNTHYKKYAKGLVIPIELDSRNSKPINKIYVKALGTDGVLGVWGFK